MSASPIAPTTLGAIEREMATLGARWRLDPMNELIDAQTDLISASSRREKRRAAIRIAAIAILLADDGGVK